MYATKSSLMDSFSETIYFILLSCQKMDREMLAETGTFQSEDQLRI